MFASTGGGSSGLSSKDRSFGFWTLGRKNIFSSNTYIADIPHVNQRCSTLQKSLSQADLLPQPFEHYYKKPAPRKQWNQPTGLISQILQEKRDILIENLKQKVKILAEESVTRNFIHEQSSNITAFCAAVDDCLRFGLILKKPVLFNREPPTYSLLKEVAKSLPEARDIVRRVQEFEESAGGYGGYGHVFNVTSPSYTDSVKPKHLWIRIALFQKSLCQIVDYLVENAASHYERVSIIAHPFDSQLFADLLRGPSTHDYTRIRTSDHLWTDPSAGELMQRKMIYSAGVQTAQQQQQGTVEGRVVAAAQKRLSEERAPKHSRSRLRPHPRLSLDLGIGAAPSAGHFQPLSVDAPGIFSLHFEPDVISPASLLYQVSSSPPIVHGSKRTLTGEVTGDENCTDEGITFDSFATEEPHVRQYHHQPHSIFSPVLSVQKLIQAKDYVESLHQNERAPLLYGKNNILVQPSMSTTRISGYLSIHKTGLDDDSGLELKWAPNRAMSVPQESEEQQRTHGGPRPCGSADDASRLLLHESSYWDFALDIDIKKVVYIHCHRHYSDADSGTVILVRADGVQYPPLTFPAFSQVISFIQCLETHLAPKGSLKPRTDEVDWNENLDSSKTGPPPISPGANGEMLSSPSSATPTQFCFFIDTFETPPAPETRECIPTTRNDAKGQHASQDAIYGNLARQQVQHTHRKSFSRSRKCMDAFSTTYQTMPHQISPRLAYTRSVNLIRNRLKNMVYPRYLVPKPPSLNAKPLTAEVWRNVRHSGGKNKLVRKLYERIYFGGCDPTLRQEVWPFLLNHYPWSATSVEIEEIDRRTRMAYERSVSEWLAAEVMILQQEQQQRQRGSAVETLAGQNAAAIRSHSTSICRESLVSDKQTVDILSDAWNKVKRRISTVTVPASRQPGEVNGNLGGSHIPANSTRITSRLPPLPPKWTHESRALKVNSGVGGTDCSSRGNSVDLTDGATEECTMTTTDDDDGVESTAVANRVRRLAIARAQSCPNSPQSLDCLMVTNRNTNFSTITQENNSDIDEVLSPLTLPFKCADDQVHRTPTQPSSERKQIRHSRSEKSGASYSSEVLEALSVNIQRIDKDVARCDRNYHYFSKAGLSNGDGTQKAVSEQSMGGLCVASLDLSANLYRLRTIMCTWVWQHMETGYVQGMCDLLAPLLVVLEDEALTYACFSQLMLRMLSKFPLASGTTFTSVGAAAAAGVVLPHLLEPVIFEYAPYRWYEFTRPKTKQQLLEENNRYTTDGHKARPNVSILAPTGSTLINQQFGSLRSLIEVLDPVLAEHMHLSEDNSHLYFYRWLLLDFKREFKYADVFLAWETIWTSYRLVCPDFEIFIAFALIQYYRDIIIFYCFDYTDIIRFYNERAEQHDLLKLLNFARDLIYRLQSLISSVSPGPATRPKTLPGKH
ncbi:small g protein signaling modulator 1 [Echinococcus multilocularis]|uniref:Small g protein signaling modulator 1 n=1 Tax=Echinococcus multilocularis TaxID=6211 RepID=A0A068YFV6_ECHMU|nr:small g protein signaling modulator 1 [Echinococcus multilocularis]